LTIPVVVGAVFLFYKGSQILLAEYKFNKSLTLLTQNDATGTYDTMREAINTNPRVDRYHATFARINLALANSIAQKAVPQEGVEAQEITDADRQSITTLIQQAINEGKATVSLNPLRAGNWETLAQVYRAVMPLAQGADAFTIQSYRQAVALDPLNPNLRIALGGIYYAIGNYDQAAQVFELAASAKPDLANAHYNLSLALKESGNLDRAIAEMSLVLSLITDKTSQDYNVAKQALETMQSEKQAQAPVEAGTGEELTPPQTAEEPVLVPPLDLPEGSEPPEAPISPTPTGGEASPTVTVTPQVTPTVTPLP
jgi:tetratricopeptide (TPR) repeat protein